MIAYVSVVGLPSKDMSLEYILCTGICCSELSYYYDIVQLYTIEGWQAMYFI